MPKLTTIINFCSNEARFISHSIQAALKCSAQVIVPFSDHFFSGDPERWAIINTCIKENPKAQFIQIPFDAALRDTYGPHFWHNVARWVGIKHCNSDSDFVLFLDADEVIDTLAFNYWFKNTDLSKINAVKFLNYWYFRDVCYQADTYEDSVVMTRLSKIKGRDVFSDSERHALKIKPALHNVVGAMDKPFIHHYSWVRTKEEMLRKVRNWGHTSDRKDWVELVQEEFSRPFSGRDFVHNYTFYSVEAMINLDGSLDAELGNSSEKAKAFKNKRVLSTEERNKYLSQRSLFFRLFNKI
jgi:hypothetical protein